MLFHMKCSLRQCYELYELYERTYMGLSFTFSMMILEPANSPVSFLTIFLFIFLYPLSNGASQIQFMLFCVVPTSTKLCSQLSPRLQLCKLKKEEN